MEALNVNYKPGTHFFLNQWILYALDIGAKNLPKKCQIWKLLHKPVDY